MCIAWLHMTRLALAAETNRLICIAGLHKTPPRRERVGKSGLMQVGGAAQHDPSLGLTRCA